MKIHNLQRFEHTRKVGQACPSIEPNVFEDTLFMLDGEPVGFFIKQLPEKMSRVANFADAELRSDRVPKSTMNRTSSGVKQYSTIIGATPIKRHLGRHYANISSVHRTSSAREFIRSMKLLAHLSEQMIKELMPNQYAQQVQSIGECIEERLRFSKMFTSSISNYNISAPFHQDNGNLKNTVNVIVNKKYQVTGGNLHVPDFDLTFDGSDNSMIVYPAWKSVHGVTPIEQKNKRGYRNSLVFYPYDLRK
tara:strand:+ start:13933 stop:14679 length:747 start_codon:yes stop_codon:yes gene_type:complete